MNFRLTLLQLLFSHAVLWTLIPAHANATNPVEVLLIAGEILKKDTPGHHDYIGGVKCLDLLLKQSPQVKTTVVETGWPSDEAVLDRCRSIVFYMDGGGKQSFFQPTSRWERIQQLAKKGTGIVLIHQAVDFPEEFAEQAKALAGGIYVTKLSGRGHWDSKHVDFPKHPITRGVEPWEINDGWLNKLQFVPQFDRITPLVWSGKEYGGSRAGLDKDIVSFAYERPDGGRSFSFSGLDAHSAWSRQGVRQLMVNGILWSAGLEIPSEGSPCKMSDAELAAVQTPREPKDPVKPKQ